MDQKDKLYSLDSPASFSVPIEVILQRGYSCSVKTPYYLHVTSPGARATLCVLWVSAVANLSIQHHIEPPEIPV